MAHDSTEAAFDWGDQDDEQNQAPERPTHTDTGGTGGRGALAIFGGLYAVWSIAWVIGIASAPAQTASSLLDAVMYQFGEFLGLIATPLWLGSVWFLTSESARRARTSWLILGLLLLFPVPFVLPILVID